MTYPHPACMEPDGGEGPCAGYLALDANNQRLREALLEAKSWIEELYKAHTNISPGELIDGTDRRMHPIIRAIQDKPTVPGRKGE